jgi:hypothetical protein
MLLCISIGVADCNYEIFPKANAVVPQHNGGMMKDALGPVLH